MLSSIMTETRISATIEEAEGRWLPDTEDIARARGKKRSSHAGLDFAVLKTRETSVDAAGAGLDDEPPVPTSRRSISSVAWRTGAMGKMGRKKREAAA